MFGYYFKQMLKALFHSKNSYAIEKIKTQLEYYEDGKQEKREVYAYDLMHRFEELYDLLGVERKQTDWSQCKPELVKKPKKK